MSANAVWKWRSPQSRRNSDLDRLLREVDSALDRMADGTYGLCLECHESIEEGALARGSADSLLPRPPDQI